MPNYKDHTSVINLLREDQEADRDQREIVREVLRFLYFKNGQWDEDQVNNVLVAANRPRYTFDRCNDIVDDIAGEMEQADFDIRVKPAGGDATKDTAKVYDGLIRNIENLSDAKGVFNAAGRRMVAAGIDGWEVVQRWGDNDTFDQDLFIDPISDFVDRVWFDSTAELPTKADGGHCWKLQSMSKDRYKEKWPDGAMQSIDSDSSVSSLETPDVVTVGVLYYKVKAKQRIIKMTNGSVYKDDEKYQQIKDELADRGVNEERDRTRDIDLIKIRTFDGGGWLSGVQATVFDFLPIIPTFGNYTRSQNVSIYWGIISKKMDAQRVYNYAESRKVEEGALAPLEKIVATDDQIGPHAKSWEKLNTSADPALRYVHNDNQPPPYKIGGAQINPGLETVSASAQQNLQSVAGLEALTGQALGLQSGTALELKQNKGDTRNYKYTVSQERAIEHTAKILVRAIPKVYDTKRQERVLNEDESFDMVVLNEPVRDEETGQMVTLNDLSKGTYDVTCGAGEAFKNRQKETAQSFNEVLEFDPTVMELGRDVYFNNLTTPGMDLIAERARRDMLLKGAIPEEQMTDEEKEFLANQEPQEDPVAEALRREADNADDEVELKGARLVLDEERHELDKQKVQLQANQDSMTEAMDQINTAAESLNKQADTFKKLAEAMAVEGVDVPNLLPQQAAVIRDDQAEQP